MKLSMPLDHEGGFRESAQRVAELERAGLDIIWAPEAYGFDGVSLMGYLAGVTEHVTIGAAILPVFTRTPSLIAMTAAGLDMLSAGRFILGLGASGPQVIEGFHGLPYDRPVARTREIIDICRRAWRRERLEHSGSVYQLPLPKGSGSGLGKPLKLISPPLRDRIPIYVAALGGRSVRQTAEVAEGWLPIFYLPERAQSVWGADLAAGTAARSTDLPPLEIVAGGNVAIGPDAAALRELARPMLAMYVGGMGARGKNFYNELARRYGFEAEAERIQDLFLDGNRDEAAAAVPDELIEKTTLCGSAGYVRERIAAFRESGVTVLNVTPVGGDPVGTIAQLKELMA